MGRDSDVGARWTGGLRGWVKELVRYFGKSGEKNTLLEQLDRLIKMINHTITHPSIFKPVRAIFSKTHWWSVHRSVCWSVRLLSLSCSVFLFCFCFFHCFFLVVGVSFLHYCSCPMTKIASVSCLCPPAPDCRL